MKYFGMTDIGLKRSTNQDAFFAGYVNSDTLVVAVCDGMGGAAGGTEASHIALSGFTDALKSQLCENKCDDFSCVLVKSIEKANAEVFETSKENPELSGMGTTMVCAVVRDNKIYLASIGDSRIYVYANGVFRQLTHDHSYVQTLVDSGQITQEQAKVHPNRNIITKAIGTSKEVEPDVFLLDKQSVSSILLCSDGLCGYVEHEVIEKLVESHKSAKELVFGCIASALDVGAPDNVTVAVLCLDADNNDTTEGGVING